MKKKVLTVFCIILVIFITCKGIYHYYYEIDFSDYSEFISLGIYRSPDDKYTIKMSILVPRVKHGEYYILGELIINEYISKNNQIISDDNTKIVFFEKKTGNAPFTLEKNIYVNWIDDSYFQIENKKLKVNGNSFDYRRDF